MLLSIKKPLSHIWLAIKEACDFKYSLSLQGQAHSQGTGNGKKLDAGACGDSLPKGLLPLLLP